MIRTPPQGGVPQKGFGFIRMAAAGKLVIYTDANCRFCQWARDAVEPYDDLKRLEFRDFNDPRIAAETPFSPEQLREQMYVRAPDGRWHRGFYGWVAILSALPRRRGIIRLLATPPLPWLGPAIYRFIARHRYQIPEFVLRRLGIPMPCDDKCLVKP